MMKVYTGIGSRKTPDEILSDMSRIAMTLAELGWTLRSGCAPGADSAFERGTSHGGPAHRRELYLPWRGFEDRPDDWVERTEPQIQAYDMAGQFHPRWATLSAGARRLHARNVHQILGPDVTRPILSRFVICWTKDGKGGGGTGQALRIAQHHEVPIFDLALNSDREQVMKLFE